MKRDEFQVPGCNGVIVGVGVLVDVRGGPERQSSGIAGLIYGRALYPGFPCACVVSA